MDRVLSAFVARSNHASQTPSDAKVQVLESACCLLDSTPPDAINSTSVSVASSSLEEAHRLAQIARQFATEHRLLVLIEFGDKRLRVKFLPLHGDAGAVSG